MKEFILLKREKGAPAGIDWGPISLGKRHGRRGMRLPNLTRYSLLLYAHDEALFSIFSWFIFWCNFIWLSVLPDRWCRRRGECLFNLTRTFLIVKPHEPFPPSRPFSDLFLFKANSFWFCSSLDMEGKDCAFVTLLAAFLLTNSQHGFFPDLFYIRILI